jgi:cytochrome oxidase Cu insertion factor (SCO1/SenC/PrrC family)
MKRRPLIGLGLGLLATIGAVAVVAAPHSAKRSAELENFHLMAPSGRPYSIESFSSGSVLAVYFGYATCLRTCPTALNSIAEAIDRLGAVGASVQPVFIDLDPERAALLSIPLYMEAFGPRFLGLTGSPEDIEGGREELQSQSRADPIQCRSQRLCDETRLSDFRDAAQRSAPQVTAGDELAR